MYTSLKAVQTLTTSYEREGGRKREREGGREGGEGGEREEKRAGWREGGDGVTEGEIEGGRRDGDRKSTRLNSSHVRTSRMPSSA